MGRGWRALPRFFYCHLFYCDTKLRTVLEVEDHPSLHLRRTNFMHPIISTVDNAETK